MNSVNRFDLMLLELEKIKERKVKRLEKRKVLGLGSKVKRKKLPSHAKCEQKYWNAFAAYIRERDKDRGCFSCGGPVESAGHLISRRRRATKYSEINVNGQCLKCNWSDKFRPGFHDHCVTQFIRRYDVGIYHGMVIASQDFCKRPSRQDCLVGEVIYKEKLEHLKSTKIPNSKDCT